MRLQQLLRSSPLVVLVCCPVAAVATFCRFIYVQLPVFLLQLCLVKESLWSREAQR